MNKKILIKLIEKVDKFFGLIDEKLMEKKFRNLIEIRIIKI